MIELTKKEREMFHSIPATEYNSDHKLGAETWGFCVCDSHAEAGVLGSLVKKGLVLVGGKGEDCTVQLSEEGQYQYLLHFSNDENYNLEEAVAKRYADFLDQTTTEEDKMSKIENLRKAASDLNTVLGLKPKINSKLPKEELVAKLTEAAEFLQDGDKVQAVTKDVLLGLEIDVPAGLKVVKSAAKKSSAKKSSAKKSSAKKSSAKNTPSNKQVVYRAWKGGEGESDPKKLFEKVEGRVLESTIRSWIGQWKKGKNLPAEA